MSAKFRLGIMMFLEYAIWGAWAPVLSAYLENTLGFSGGQVGFIYSLLPLATIIAPFIGGQLADRYFPTQKVIAFLQLVGGVILLLGAAVTTYSAMMWVMLLYCLIYAPTLALTNSIAFINLKNSEKDFGKIRVWGTIGWIAAGLGAGRLAACWPSRCRASPSRATRSFWPASFLDPHGRFRPSACPTRRRRKKGQSPGRSSKLSRCSKTGDFLIFTVISFVVATELQFYYVLTAPFLTSAAIGVSQTPTISAVMTIAQIAEIFVMALLLPYFLPKVRDQENDDPRRPGLAAPLHHLRHRHAGLAGHRLPVPPRILLRLLLHGGLHLCGHHRAQRHPASAQSLIAVIILGLGNFVGSNFSRLDPKDL